MQIIDTWCNSENSNSYSTPLFPNSYILVMGEAASYTGPLSKVPGCRSPSRLHKWTIGKPFIILLDRFPLNNRVHCNASEFHGWEPIATLFTME